MAWIRTQTNQPNETLVNLDKVTALHICQDAIYADISDGRVLLTYFDGDDSGHLCRLALSELWGELKAGVQFIDMRDVCQIALERSEED